MPLPHVQVSLSADGTGEVLVDGVKLPGVLGVQIVGAARDVPHVAVTIRPGTVVADLPEAGVQLLQAGPTAAGFAEQLNPARLEALALKALDGDDDLTQGEAFAAAVARMADEYAQTRG